MPRRSPAVEPLEKLVKDEVKARLRRNLVESRRFAEMLPSAVIRSQDQVTMSPPTRWLLRSARE